MKYDDGNCQFITLEKNQIRKVWSCFTKSAENPVIRNEASILDSRLLITIKLISSSWDWNLEIEFWLWYCRLS